MKLDYFLMLQHEKPSTPISKSATPTSSGSVTPGPSSGMKPVPKPPLGMYLFFCLMLPLHVSSERVFYSLELYPVLPS